MGAGQDRVEPLDLAKEDLREGRDDLRPVGKKTPQPPARSPSLGDGDHPLTHRKRSDNAIDSMCRRLHHAAAVARGADNFIDKALPPC